MMKRFCSMIKIGAFTGYKITKDDMLLIIAISITVLQLVYDYLKNRKR